MSVRRAPAGSSSISNHGFQHKHGGNSPHSFILAFFHPLLLQSWRADVKTCTWKHAPGLVFVRAAAVNTSVARPRLKTPSLALIRSTVSLLSACTSQGAEGAEATRLMTTAGQQHSSDGVITSTASGKHGSQHSVSACTSDGQCHVHAHRSSPDSDACRHSD